MGGMGARTTRRGLLGAGAGLALAGQAAAQPAPAWPVRPVRLVVPFTAAGTTDILARIMAERLTTRLGQPVVVDNRPGAGGNLGADLVAKAEPDGLTLLMTTIGTGAINYALYRSMPFRPGDLAAVHLTATLPNVVMVANELPVRTVGELIALARARPGGLTHGSSGNGTSLHLTMEMLKAQLGLDMVHVPFRGASPMLTELMAGRLDTAVDNLPSSLQQIRDGRMRAIAVTTATRSAALPEVPTMQEAGVPGFEATAWFGLQAPGRTPRALIGRMNAECQAALDEPATRARIVDQGADPAGGSPERFEALITSEIVKWADVVRRAHITVD